MRKAFEPQLRHRRYRDLGCPLERRSSHQRCDIVPHEREPLIVDEVRFRQCDDPGTNAQESQDGQVLSGLRHHAFIGRDDEQCEIDAGGARKHCADERFVSRDVNDPDRPHARELERRKSELDRDAPSLLLGQSIRIDAGQRSHQRRLAVIDMAGGA